MIWLVQAALQEVKSKYRKFQNPSELEPRLERMFRVLRDLEQSMCYIELASDDCEAIEGQLNNCIVSVPLCQFAARRPLSICDFSAFPTSGSIPV